MTRARLPTRRPNETVDLSFDGHRFAVCIGFDLTGRPAEVFARCHKATSALDLLADDIGVVLSLALQHGALPGDLAHSMGRLRDKPASLAGALVDLLAEHAGAAP